MGSKVEELFLQEKPNKIILMLSSVEKPVYVAKLAKGTDSTYAHTFRLVSKLEELGLVMSKDEGRIKLVKLTEIGKALAGELSDLLCLMELAELSVAITALYEREVKGHRREDIKKETVLGRLEQYGKKLDRLVNGKSGLIESLAKKELRRVDEISKEVKGLIVG